MCTVLLRFSPGERWPVLLGAIRDEFVERPWDPPARHWDGPWADLVGGRDHTAGGTWLAVDPGQRAVAALLNGFRRDPPPPEEGPRPTRGELALRVLAGDGLPTHLERYDRFHLLTATPERVELWSWDGDELCHVAIDAGPHIVVNAGLDALDDPLVPHFAPLVAELPSGGDDPSLAWPSWIDLLRGDGLDPSDERALLVRKQIEGRTYGTTSSSLMALSKDGVRYSFTPTPSDPASWREVGVRSRRDPARSPTHQGER
jgi:uncharacterized protein with NRDE domain